MKPMVTKALVCGILASSFFIINCQKAPSRGVKAEGGNNKVTQANALPACSSDALGKIGARLTILNETKKALEAWPENAPHVLSDGEKADLNIKIGSLSEKSRAAVSAIRASAAPASKAPAEGCKKQDMNDPNITKDIKVSELLEEDRAIAARVSQLSGQSNAILDRAAGQLSAGKEITIKADLAAMLSNEANFNGEKAISEGQILSKEQYEALKNDKSKTSCIIKSADKAAVAADAKAKVVDISVPKAEGQRMMSDLNLVIKGESDRPVAISCAIADNQVASEEMTTALGELISAAPAATPAPTPTPAPAPGGQAPPPAPAPGGEAPTPAPAPGGEAPTPAPAPGGEAPTPAPAPGGETPTPAPAPAPQVTAQQVQEAEAVNALVQRLNQGH